MLHSYQKIFVSLSLVSNNLTNYVRRHFKLFTNCHISWDTLYLLLLYRVSHIKLDRVNESKLRIGDKSENLRRMNHFEKFNKANRIFFLQKVLDFPSIMCVFWR